MNCREVRRTLWPADALRISDDAVEQALEHAKDCSSCRHFLEQDRRIAELVRGAVPRVSAPRELRERLYTALARERAGRAPIATRARRRPWTLVAAVVVTFSVASLGYWQTRRVEVSESAATAFAEDYLRRVVEQEELRGGDRPAIAAFFARELGVSVSPPDVPEFILRRATICLMNGHRGGVVEYESRGRHFSYYLIPLSGAEAERARRQAPIAPALAEERGLSVATWWDGQHQHALVGNLSAKELSRLAPLFTVRTSSL